MKKNKILSLVCQDFADMVSGCDDYRDYASLVEAVDITINRLPESISREDLTGWLNPHLDSIYDNWAAYE